MTLTATGLVTQTFEEIREEINTEVRSSISAGFGLTDDHVAGRFVAIIAETAAKLNERLQQVYDSQDPSAATGSLLEYLCALTGVRRLRAMGSTATLTLTGTDTTLVPQGSQASNTNGDAFETDLDATLAVLPSWVSSTAYALEDRVTNGGNCYQCVTAGTSAGSGGPTTEASVIADGSVSWRYLGGGDSAVDATATAVETGPTVAVSGDITTIDTPVSGWTSVNNILDANVGSFLETNEDLRVRREVSVGAGGSTTEAAIRADMLNVPGVTSATVFFNDSDATVDGVPPHAVECLIEGTQTNQSIWDQLLLSVAAGIRKYGTVSGTATASNGTVYTVAYSVPTTSDIYVDITLEYGAGYAGDSAIKEAIATYGDAQLTGRDVVSSAIKAACFGVPGVLDVSLAYIGTSASPVSETTIPITTRQLAVYDTSRITVDSSEGTP